MEKARLPEPVAKLCQAFMQGLKSALEDKLYGVYIYGAVVFPEGGPTGDVDFHVIISDRLSKNKIRSLRELHEQLAKDFPPHGADMDGYYILLEDARRPELPPHQFLPGVYDASWALHRQHILAGRCVTLYGPDPMDIYPPATWPELEKALYGELKFVEDNLDRYPDYCILNLCRLIYSFETHDVVISKAAASAWAERKFPQWQPHIEAARRSYAHQAIEQDRHLMFAEVSRLYQFTLDQIRQNI
jgi:Aminoglycoside adenylyltransferase, C-terminal domain